MSGVTLLAVQPRADELPALFPSPFDDVAPHALARRCAELVMEELRAGSIAPGVSTQPLYRQEGGKMFGVLVVRDAQGQVGFLKALSGQLERRWHVEGYAPPAFDEAARAAVEVPAEVVVKALTARSEAARKNSALLAARETLAVLDARHAEERAALKKVHAQRKAQRRELRSQPLPAQRGEVGLQGREGGEPRADAPLPGPLPAAQGEGDARRALDEQSRADDRERRAQQQRFREERAVALEKLKPLERHLAALDRLRPLVSLIAMRRIWDSYVLRNFAGEETPLRALFTVDPPSGAGDCAAVKLLVHAQRLGVTPLALAEFWWGAPPPAGARVEGMYFPACKEKCGPILPFLLRGLDVAPRVTWKPRAPQELELETLYEDDWLLVVNKPHGLLSVPARDEAITDSVQARVRQRHPNATPAHRLDLDTSGVLVVAKDADTLRLLMRAFESREVQKEYVAVLDGEVAADEGTVSLPLRVDLEARPRQVVDFVHGKEAVTKWRVQSREPGRTRVQFFPLTGRTHQLRVHSAHHDGLGVAIVGDRLYGHEGARLLLHAHRLSFTHPHTGETLHFTAPVPF